MAKKIDYQALKKVGDEWGCLLSPEELRFWSLAHKWRKGIFSENGLQISSVSVKASRIVGESSTRKYSKKAPLILKNGFEITKGTKGLTSQNHSVRYPNMIVDSIAEFNDAMVLLSELDEMDIWEITGYSFWNTKHRARILFKHFSPNEGTGCNLYLDRVFDDSGERPYATIPYYEQQELCNYFTNTTAACIKVMVETVDCKVKHLKEMAQANANT